jgi:membrane protein required for colicin V production
MIWLDYAVLGIIAVSAVISLMRGFVREALSLLTWIAAVWVSLVFAQPLAGFMEPLISAPSVRIVVAFAVLFLATLLLGALINHLVMQLVRRTGLTGTDRMIGVVFGAARGVAIVVVLVLLSGLTPVPQDPWWRESLLIGHFEDAAIWLGGFLPLEIAQNIRFE